MAGWTCVQGATISWNNPGGGAWSSANNWSPTQVPGPADTVLVSAAGSYNVTLSGNVQIGSLTAGGGSASPTLTVSGGTLTVTNGATIAAGATLNLNNSTLVGALSVAGALNCNAASIGNGGAVVIASSAVLTISGSSLLTLNGPLTNAGTINWGGTGNLQIYNNYTAVTQTGGIMNQPGALFNLQNDQTINGSGTPYLINAGTIWKSAGTSTTTINVWLNNLSELNVAGGTVALGAGGTNNGSITGAGKVNVPNGTFTLKGFVPFLVLSGSGTVNGVNAAIGNLTWSSGTLQGNNTITGQANWTGGTLANSSSLTISNSAVLTLSGTTVLNLNGVLTNAGTVNWTGTANLQVYNNYNGPAQTGGIINQAGAVFNAQNDQTITGNGNAYFYNTGTFTKSARTNSTALNLLFNNSGELNVASGTVALPAGGTNTGTISGPGAVAVPGGTYTVNGTLPNLVVSGSGTLNGVNATIGNLTWSSGTLLGNNTVTGQANWTGGTLANSSSITISDSAVLTIAGTSALTLNGVLTNAGTVNWAGTANLQVYNNYNGPAQTGGIINRAGAMFNAQNDQTITGNGNAYFYNAGTFTKSARTNSTVLNLLFNNTGELNAASGTVALAAGGTNAGGTISGPGAVSIPNGTYTLSGLVPNLVLSGNGTINGLNASIGNLTWSGGTLQGNTTVTGPANWTGGTLANSSSFTISSGAVLTIGGTSSVYLYGVLTNAGTVNWTGTANLQVYNNYSNPTQTGGIVNQPNAVFNALNNQTISGNGAAYFNNAGTFSKSTGTNVTTLNLLFNNTGVLSLNIYGRANVGGLSFSGNVVLGGLLNITLNNGYSPAVGDSFRLLTYGSETGAFSGVALVPNAFPWETNLLTYGSTALTLTIGSIYKLVFAPAPAATNSAGIQFAPVVVQLQNVNGAAFASNGVPVSLAMSSSGTLSGTTTQTTDAAGKATFNDLSIDLVGLKTLTASSPPWVTPATSPTLIVAGPPAQLRVSASAGSVQRQGYAFAPAPTVQVADRFANIISNSTLPITVSSLSGGAGKLSGTLTGNANGVNGSATFVDLRYTLGNQSQSESVVLYFDSPGLQRATNGPVLVGFFVPGTLTLTNGNSLVQIDPHSQNGVFNWVVDGTSHLFQQWFWLRWTNNPQLSIDELGAPLGVSVSSDNASFSYLPQGLSVALSFFVHGATVGSGASTVTETVTVQNTTASPVILHLYAYTDFDLGGNFDGETVSFPSNKSAMQQGHGVTATQTIQGATPNFWEASWNSLTLDTLNGTTPAILSNTIRPNQPGDQTFAYQWDFSLSAGQSFVVNFANTVQAPTRTALSIALSGPEVLLSWPTSSDSNLKLQSNSTLDGSVAWANVTVTPITVGGNYQVTLPATASVQFFRLH